MLAGVLLHVITTSEHVNRAVDDGTFAQDGDVALEEVKNPRRSVLMFGRGWLVFILYLDNADFFLAGAQGAGVKNLPAGGGVESRTI